MISKVYVNLLFFLVLFPILQSKSCEALADVSVGRWARFETSVKNEEKYRNSYRDVALDVTYKNPDGKEVKFWGFYDGNRTWKIRFMPDRIGTWKYDAVLSHESQSKDCG